MLPCQKPSTRIEDSETEYKQGNRGPCCMSQSELLSARTFGGLLGDALTGDGALFTREDAVEAAWAVVDPVLKRHHRFRPSRRHTWGPKEADLIIASDGGWRNPRPEEPECTRFDCVLRFFILFRRL